MGWDPLLIARATVDDRLCRPASVIDHLEGDSHGLTHDGSRYFGLLRVANGTNPEGFGLVVGVRNSHDKSFPCGVVINLVFSQRSVQCAVIK